MHAEDVRLGATETAAVASHLATIVERLAETTQELSLQVAPYPPHRGRKRVSAGRVDAAWDHAAAFLVRFDGADKRTDYA